MLGIFGRRTVDLVVLFLAAYAFAFVPLGRRTGLEHVRAILHTRAAKNAGREATEAAEKLWHKLVNDSATAAPLPAHGKPILPDLKN